MALLLDCMVPVVNERGGVRVMCTTSNLQRPRSFIALPIEKYLYPQSQVSASSRTSAFHWMQVPGDACAGARLRYGHLIILGYTVRYPLSKIILASLTWLVS